MSLARAVITGIVTKNPEKRFTQNDMAMTGFTVNIDQNNETLLRVITFGALADTVAGTIVQGDSVAVEGKLQINSYTLPNGQQKRVYEIQANSVEKMGATVGVAIKGSSQKQASSNATQPQIAQQSQENIVQFNQDEIASDLIDEDEIPF